MTLKNSGSNIFAASFLAKIANNLLDKVGTCMIAYVLIQRLPANIKDTLRWKQKIVIEG
jgi:energy-coupling factor transport system substrate-specific component